MHVLSMLSIAAASATLGLLICCGPTAWAYLPAALILTVIRALSSARLCVLPRWPLSKRSPQPPHIPPPQIAPPQTPPPQTPPPQTPPPREQLSDGPGAPSLSSRLSARLSVFIWLFFLPIVLSPAAFTLASALHAPPPAESPVSGSRAGALPNCSAPIGDAFGEALDVSWAHIWPDICAESPPQILSAEPPSLRQAQHILALLLEASIGCSRAQGSAAPLLASAAHALAQLGIVSRPLLAVLLQNLVVLSALAGGRAQQEPLTEPPLPRSPPPLDALPFGANSNVAYRSGRFALNVEAGQSHHPSDRYLAYTMILKTPPTLFWLLLLLLFVAIEGPLGALLRLAARLLRLSKLLKPREQTEYERRVSAELSRLIAAAARAEGLAEKEADEAECSEPPARPFSLYHWARALRDTLYRSAPAWCLLPVFAPLLVLRSPPCASHGLLLPLYPSLYLILGGLGRALTRYSRSPIRLALFVPILGLLCITHVLETIITHPDYLSYVAPVGGGSKYGHFHLLGDSLDQGQQLPLLAEWLREHVQPGEPVFLAYSGEDSPRMRGLVVRRLPSSPEPLPYWDEAAAPMPPTREMPSSRVGSASERGGETLGGLELPALPLSPQTDELPESSALDGRTEDAGHSGSSVALASSRTGIGSLALDWPSESLLAPGVYCIDANMLQAYAGRFKGPWSSEYENVYQGILEQRGGSRVAAATAGLTFARLIASLRRTEPTAQLGHTLFIWRLSAADLSDALLGEPAELLSSSILSPGMRKYQRRQVLALLANIHLDESCQSTGGSFACSR